MACWGFTRLGVAIVNEEAIPEGKKQHVIEEAKNKRMHRARAETKKNEPKKEGTNVNEEKLCSKSRVEGTINIHQSNNRSYHQLLLQKYNTYNKEKKI
jgi:hypothetical protein